MKIAASISLCYSLFAVAFSLKQSLRGGGFAELLGDAFGDTDWGLDASQLIAGVDCESDDRALFDNDVAIAKKAEYVCEEGLAGMMSWRLDNDNVVQGRPTFAGAKQVLHDLQACSGCKWDSTKGWSVSTATKDSNHTSAGAPAAVTAGRCPIIGGYVGAFDSGFFCETGECRYKQLPFESITRLYIAFVYIQGGECKFRYSNDEGPQNEARRGDFQDLIRFARSKNPQLEVFVTSGLDLASYNGCQSKGKREVFADSLVQMLQELDADGYDMDWEKGIVEPMVATIITTVSERLRVASRGRPRGRPPYGITMAVSAAPEQGFNFTLIKAHVGQLNLMTYGPGPQRSLRQSVMQYTSGFSSSSP